MTVHEWEPGGASTDAATSSQTSPPLRESSILTAATPKESQVTFRDDPIGQDSPPFGAVTRMPTTVTCVETVAVHPSESVVS
ncbi:MAG: hypothetical protein ACYS9X_20225, partial [Planctomycetota bacterium]